MLNTNMLASTQWPFKMSYHVCFGMKRGNWIPNIDYM